MKRNVWNALGTAGCALLFAISMTAADKPVTKPHKAEVHKTAAKVATRHWRPETLSGKIAMVDPAKKTVVVEGADGVPFDMIVTRATRIESGSQTLKLSDLASKSNQNASVHFVPERRGDVAQSIQITG
jgi:hypothetical protein